MADPIIYDDTDATAAGSTAIGSATGFSFTTSSAASGSLVDVKLELKDASASTDGGYVAVTLYNNAAGTNEPGAQIESLGTIKDAQLNTNGSGTLVDIPLAGANSLDPSTRYWIELSSVGGSDAALNFESGDGGVGVATEYSNTSGHAAQNIGGAYIASVTEEVTCFVAGTSIRTARGEVAVEALAVGDCVVTGSGGLRPIRWLGHRAIACRRNARPAEIMPIRIAANAFGENRPARDLFVSPGHSICVDVLGEILIPAGALLNGSTIQQMEVESVTYWHVELDSHDILLAENLACESYLEMGNRNFFAEEGVISLAAMPDAKMVTHADFCRPFVDGGPMLNAVKARLGERAAALLTASSATEMFRGSAGRRARGR